MLREIINFQEFVKPESYFFRLRPAEGIHLQVTLDKAGNYQKHEMAFYRDGVEMSPFLNDCLRRQLNSDYISMQKVFDTKKKIHSCSPFCVAFRMKVYDKAPERIEDYFNVALSYCETDSQKEWTNIFAEFCKSSLSALHEKVISKVVSEQQKTNKKFKLADNYYIYTYLANVSLSEMEQVHKNYLTKKVFNKEEYNIEVEDTIFGVTNYLTGYNQKKPYMQHRTATFELGSRLTSEEALVLHNFSKLQANRIFPNPLPIFIDKKEINDRVVSIFNREGEKRISYSEIIRKVYAEEKNLGNYYLFNFSRGSVHDFDFVSAFRLNLDSKIKIQELFKVYKTQPSEIKDIFQFEQNIVQAIFDNQLIQKTKDGGLRYRYFDDIEYKPQYIRATMFQLVLKYRKAFYDYIYKSRKNVITSRIFHDILQTGILDDLRQDEFKDNQHSMNFRIKNKLNIWFSLFEYFDLKPQTNGETKMAEQIRSLQAKMDRVANQPDVHLEKDREFGFAAGQVIYYLLNCSETSNKTHALLEPFLQKVDADQFKLAISRTFNQYKHAITFYKGKFEKLMAEILSYEPEANIKTLMPMILAGYFSDNVVYRKVDK